MKKVMLVLVILFAFPAFLKAQQPLKKNAIYLDGGIFYIPFVGLASVDLSYERFLFQNRARTLSLRARTGLAVVSTFSGFDETEKNNYYSVPLGISFLAGKNKDFFEISAGMMPGLNQVREEGEDIFEDTESNRFFIYPLFEIGYRRENPDKKGIFRIKAGTLGVGISVGRRF